MTFAEKLITALPIRGKQAQLAARIEDRHAMAKRALGYVELYGAYTETDARYRVDNLLELWDAGDADDHARFEFDPASIDWDRLRARDPPAVGARTHPRAHEARQVGGGQAAGPAAAGHPVARTGISPCSTSSTRSCPPTSSTPTPGWPAATSPRRGGRASWPTWCARGRRCWRWTGATAATSCAPSTAASRTHPSTQLREDSWELFHRQLLTRSFPDGLRPRAGAPGRRPPDAADHGSAGLHHRADPAALRRHRLRRDGGATTGG